MTDDPLWSEIEAFLCRKVPIPRDHRLGRNSRLGRDLKLRPLEQRELMDDYFAFFRVQRGDYDPRRIPRRSRWPWARCRAAAAPARDIDAEMLLRAARRGLWSECELAGVATAPQRER